MQTTVSAGTSLRLSAAGLESRADAALPRELELLDAPKFTLAPLCALALLGTKKGAFLRRRPKRAKLWFLRRHYPDQVDGQGRNGPSLSRRAPAPVCRETL